ncbi:MAG: hypothetical protein KAU60_06750 [Desulfobacterales bacterium]|nr:hypothetical protein [Desulfobacterales bacterium]
MAREKFITKQIAKQVETRGPFQDFFEESKYTLLKNYLYNYRLRKKAKWYLSSAFKFDISQKLYAK